MLFASIACPLNDLQAAEAVMVTEILRERIDIRVISAFKSNDELRQHLHDRSILAYPLLQW